MDMSEAQILPAEGSSINKTFFECDVSITTLFTIDLILNVFSHSANYYREFYTKAALLRMA